jgi:uncharacterized protein YicC (UPF0701 family)
MTTTPTMLRSMTGFGRGSAPLPGGAVVVELRAVNHKGLEVKCRLPRSLLAHEPAIQRACKAHLERGRIDLVIDLVKDPTTTTADTLLDQARVAAVVASVRALCQRYPEVAPSLTAGELLALPGVLARDVGHDGTNNGANDGANDGGIDVDGTATRTTEAHAALHQAVDTALEQALLRLVAARELEGHGLFVELGRRRDGIVALVDQIEARTKTQVAHKAEVLRERLGAILKDFVDEARVIAEVAVLAERLDVTEELARLRLHISQLERLLQSAGSGRRVDFLCQEFLREANTTASKCQDAATAHLVVELKAEIERLREQAQNVE